MYKVWYAALRSGASPTCHHSWLFLVILTLFITHVTKEGITLQVSFKTSTLNSRYNNRAWELWLCTRHPGFVNEYKIKWKELDGQTNNRIFKAEWKTVHSLVFDCFRRTKTQKVHINYQLNWLTFLFNTVMLMERWRLVDRCGHLVWQERHRNPLKQEQLPWCHDNRRHNYCIMGQKQWWDNSTWVTVWGANFHKQKLKWNKRCEFRCWPPVTHPFSPK